MSINFFNEKNKNVWKFLFLVFVLSFIILNWTDIYWVFNPKVAPEGIKTLISQEPEKEPEKEPEYTYSERENSIDILAIGITAPIVESQGTSNYDFEIALDKGVLHFPESVKPGEKGVTILLGHSAPPGWPKIKHDWVFSDLEKLEQGDQIEVYFEKKKYVYQVTEKIFLEVGQDVPAPVSDQPEVILLSCWPPGKNLKRIGVKGVLTK
jgi:LPXTG-site transpeptidase (sortase) family protein